MKVVWQIRHTNGFIPETYNQFCIILASHCRFYLKLHRERKFCMTLKCPKIERNISKILLFRKEQMFCKCQQQNVEYLHDSYNGTSMLPWQWILCPYRFYIRVAPRPSFYLSNHECTSEPVSDWLKSLALDFFKIICQNFVSKCLWSIYFTIKYAQSLQNTHKTNDYISVKILSEIFKFQSRTYIQYIHCGDHNGKCI